MIRPSIADRYRNAIRYVHHYYYRQVCLMHKKLGDDAGDAMKDRSWQAYALRSARMLAGDNTGSLSLNEIARTLHLTMSSFGLGIEIAPNSDGFDVLVSKCPDKASLEALGAAEWVKCYKTCLSMARSIMSVMNPNVRVELREKMPHGEPHCRFEYRLASDRYTLGSGDFPEIPAEVKYEVMSNFSVGAYCSFVATWASELGIGSADVYVEDTWSEVVRLASNDYAEAYGGLNHAEKLADFLAHFWGAIGVKDTTARSEGSHIVLDIRDCGFGSTMAAWGRDFGLTCRHTCDTIIKMAATCANIRPERMQLYPNPTSGNCSLHLSK